MWAVPVLLLRQRVIGMWGVLHVHVYMWILHIHGQGGRIHTRVLPLSWGSSVFNAEDPFHSHPLCQLLMTVNPSLALSLESYRQHTDTPPGCATIVGRGRQRRGHSLSLKETWGVSWQIAPHPADSHDSPSLGRRTSVVSRCSSGPMCLTSGAPI